MILLLGQSAGALTQALVPPAAWSGSAVGLGETQALRLGLIAALGVIVIMTTVLLARMSRMSGASRSNKAFLDGCAKASLSPEETNILRCMANLAELKQTEAILSTAPLFYRGANALMGSTPVESMSDDGRMYITSLMLSIREKLGLNVDPDESTIYSSRQVKDGSRIQMIVHGWPGTYDGHIAKNNPLEMIVQPVSPMDLQPRQMITVRYLDGAKAWEFETTVVRAAPDLALGHCETVRCINRRRFPRIPVERDAMVAAFPFARPAGDAMPKFIPARLVEIGGPGLCLEAPLAIGVGDRALVVMMVASDKVFEAMGKVRRVVAKGEQNSISVELVSLNNEEVAQLSHETNLAVRTGGQDDEPSRWRQAEPALQGA